MKEMRIKNMWVQKMIRRIDNMRLTDNSTDAHQQKK